MAAVIDNSSELINRAERISAVEAVLPHKVRVVDAFHVVRLGLAAVDDVRRRIQHQQTGWRSNKRREIERLWDTFGVVGVACVVAVGLSGWDFGAGSRGHGAPSAG